MNPALPSTRSSRHAFHAPAFTLIEVCIAMTIAVLLLGVAVMEISGVRGQQQLKQIASQLEVTAREHLQRAVAAHRIIALELNDALVPVGGGHLEVRRYGEKKFRRPRTGELWEFAADGVCEPLELRVQADAGTVELGFDALSGCARRKSIIVKARA